MTEPITNCQKDSFKLGLVGKKLGHSLSPGIHNLFAEQTKVKITYDLFEFETEQKFLDWFSNNDLDGFNITIPYKETLIEKLDSVSPEVEKIGALNTVLYFNEKTYGFNTDIFGIAETLKKVEKSTTLVFGSGGAAKALVYFLQDKSDKIFVYNRTKSKALEIQEKFGSNVEVVGKEDLDSCVKKSNLIANCTPLGMFPILDSMPYKFNFSLEGKTVFDMVYTPRKTFFLRDAEKLGAKILNGFEMLACQAARSFEIWTAREITNKIS